MQISADDLKPILQYILPMVGGVWFVIKLVFSQWQKIEESKHAMVVKDQLNLKDAMAELKATVMTMAQVQSQTIKEMASLKDLIQEARLEMKDHRLETAKATEESKELFRRWLPLVKKMVETQLTQVGPDSVLVSGKKKS